MFIMKNKNGVWFQLVWRVAVWIATISVAPLAGAQVVVPTDFLVAVAAWPQAPEPAPAEPMDEPVVMLASLVLALDGALADGGLGLDAGTEEAVVRLLEVLVDGPVLTRDDARRRTAALLALFDGEALRRLVGYSQRRDYAEVSYLLGSEAVPFNPFYSAETLPGRAARAILRRLTGLATP